MLFRKRVRPPLNVSIQTANAVPVGAMSFAFFTPYQTPSPLLGTGVPAGSYRQEQGVADNDVNSANYMRGLGGLFAGTFALQPLSDPDYVISRPIE